MNAADNALAVTQGTVLIADDVREVRDVLARLVLRCGFTPLVVASGMEAMQVVHTGEVPLGCAFLGMSLTPIDGGIVAVIITRCAPALPVVLMSGYPAWMLADRLRYMPTVHFLEKPFTLATICTLLTAIALPQARAWGELPSL